MMAALLLTGRFRISSVSNVPKSFFLQEFQNFGVSIHDEFGQPLFDHYERNLDSGGIQLDAIRMDVRATLDKYLKTIHNNRQAIIDKEVEWLQSKGIQIALFDATPIASIVAKLASAKAVFVTNFTWDFVFREMLGMVRESVDMTEELLESYKVMVDRCAEDVSSCDYIIRYPGATPLPEQFDAAKIIPGPLISRPVRSCNLRCNFVKDDEKLLLLGFGGHAVNWKLQDSFLPAGWRCLVLRANPAMMPSARFTVMPDDVYVPDLIFACDAVLGKIGYGFFSECLTCHTPLLYVPRASWPEEKYLEDILVRDFNAGVAIPLDEYEAGNWTPYLEQAVSKKGQWDLPKYVDKEDREVTATQKVVSLIQAIHDAEL
ncbi:hypothetical protein EON65_09505 [archaeon]|nr:MAG: hypothetical protein EON65_09505 [archaeon]